MNEEKKPEIGPGPVVDLFKLVKIQNVRPAELEQPPPEHWGDVWNRFNRSMMRITAGLPTFVAEAIEGMTRAIRGATMPEEVEQKVFQAHAEADIQEEDLQSGLARRGVPPTEAIQRLPDLLRQLQAQGQKVHVEHRGDGTIVISVVRPDLEAEAVEVIRALPDRTAVLEEGPVK